MIFGNSTFANATKPHDKQANRYAKNQTPSFHTKTLNILSLFYAKIKCMLLIAYLDF